MTRNRLLFIALSLACVALFLADLALGSTDIALRDVWASLTGGQVDEVVRDIVLKIRLTKAVVAVVLVAWITDWLDMYAIHFVIQQVMQVGLIALVILFQPELRRMLDHLGSVRLSKLLGTHKPVQEMDSVIAQTVAACEVMSKERVGALIVFARDNRLDEYTKTGTMLEAQVSEQLIRNIFSSFCKVLDMLGKISEV